MRLSLANFLRSLLVAVIFVPAAAIAQCSLMPGSTLTDPNDEANMAAWLNSPNARGVLLYRMSRDGGSPSAFHSLCDNQGPTLVLIRSNETNQVFGGYNPQSWNSSANYLSGAGAFLFNLTYDYQLAQTNSVYQTYNHPQYGPTFGGGHDIYTFSSYGGQGYNYPYSYQNPSSKGYNYLSGAANFTVADIEVFKIDLNNIQTSGATNVCAGGSVTLTAPAGDSYLWSTAATTQSITVTESGDYSVQLTISGNGCSSITAHQNVVVAPPLELVITQTNASAPGACDGSVVFQPSGGMPPYSSNSFLDFAGSTINTTALSYGGPGASFTQDGDLKMTGTSYNWDNYVFTNMTTSRLAGKVFQGRVYSESNTYAMIGWHDNSTSPYYYNLSHAFYFASGNVHVYEHGNYAGSFGYYGTDTWVDFKIELLDVGAKYYLKTGASWTLITTTNTFSDTDLRMGISFYGFPGAYFRTDDWSGAAISAPTTNLCAGTYEYTITDSFGCAVTQSVTILDTQVPVSFTATATSASCSESADGSITVTAADGTAPYQYSKDGGVNFQSSNIFAGLAPGTYSVVVMDANNAVTDPQDIEVIFEDTTLPTVITQNLTVYLDEAGTASITPDQINNGSSDACGIESMVLNQTDFDCSNVGENTVALTVNDVNGNEATALAIVTVIDNIAPTLTPDADVFVDNDPTLCSAEVLLNEPVVADNCEVASITNDYPSSTFPVGETLVTWTVTDVNGNSATATQLVTVTDTEAPVITLEDVTVENSPGLCSAEVTLDAGFVKKGQKSSLKKAEKAKKAETPAPLLKEGSKIEDISSPAADGSPTVEDNCGLESVTNDYEGSIFPVGVTVVTWTVVDIHGNVSTAEQVITVTDTEEPVLAAVSDIMKSNDPGQCGAEITLTPPIATDNCEIADLSNDYNDTFFPIGETIVTWTVTDVNGNTASVEQTITVSDTELPAFETPEEIIVENIGGSCTAELDLTPPVVTDNCDVENVTSDHESSVYEVGVTIVTWTATDINGNTSTVTQRVVVQDIEAPMLAGVDDLTVDNQAGECFAEVNLTPPTATDNCEIATLVSDHPSPVFPVGETLVTWTATDIHGNTSETYQVISVNDAELPVIGSAPDIEVNAGAGICSAEVILSAPTASDNCGVESVTSDQESTAFPVGETLVTWTATDVNGNISTATQKITVTDTEAPVITGVDNITTGNTPGMCGAEIKLKPAARDNCGVASLTSDHPSSTFPIGTTIVTWTATDIHGNSSTAQQTVTVTDDEAPRITPGADVLVKAGKGCSAEVNLERPRVSDNCKIASLSNDHPSNLYPAGTTTVTWTVTDASGNTSTATQKVTVVGGGTDGDIVIKSVTPSSLLLPVFSPVSLKIEYKGSVDKISVDWGDGSTDDYKAKSSPFTAKHTYGITGVHTVGVVLSNSCGSGKAVYEYVVTYDGDDGFVAGSGWINSPSNACSNEWKSSSRANFGFVSKYKKGSTKPNGETKFHFIAGNINFESTTYEYLKVSDSRAQFKGTGTINGSGNYNFQVTAVDGKKERYRSTDKFRIRITQGRKVIYDNQRDDDDWDNCRESTALAGGSIIISVPDKRDDHDHFGGHDISGKFCEAFPNPIRSHVSVRLFNPNKERVLIYLMDMTGKNLQCRELPSSEDGVYNLDTEHLASGVYILKVIRGMASESMKVVKD